MELILSNKYWKSFDRLDGGSQNAANQAVMQFMRDPNTPGLNYEALNMKEKRFRSIRANRDVRIIVLADGARRTAMYVDHHDRAYDWAKRHKGEVNAVTGSMQMVEHKDVIEERIRYVTREVPMPPLFIEESDDYLLSLGVPPVYLDSLKEINDAEQLLNFCIERLPEEAGEADRKSVV